jgi:hypothetical protein
MRYVTFNYPKDTDWNILKGQPRLVIRQVYSVKATSHTIITITIYSKTDLAAKRLNYNGYILQKKGLS